MRPNSDMKINAILVDQIKRFEGDRLKDNAFRRGVFEEIPHSQYLDQADILVKKPNGTDKIQGKPYY